MRQRWTGGLVIGLLGLAGLVAAPAAFAGVASVTHHNTGLHFAPLGDFGSVQLRVSGPDFELEKTFLRGEAIGLDTSTFADGQYNWSLVASPLRTLKRAERREVRSTSLPGMSQSGSFAVAGGLVADPDQFESVTSRDIQHLDDVIITFSLCVGNDCVNGESFGFDTIRLKENNLRLHFQDTSSTASFPTNDWRIVINDSSNGGGNYFAVEDSSAGRQVFRVDAGARVNALRVDSAGDVGFGTSNPVVNLHVVDGNTPTLRLEQDGSSGFTPQTWDLAGNEANFFIRDATNGSTLPFRIEPGADSDTLYIDASNDIGIGTNNPGTIEDGSQASVHIRRTDGDASLLIQEASGSAATRELLELENNGGVLFRLQDTSQPAANDFVDVNFISGELRINFEGSAVGAEMTLSSSGDLTVSGEVFSTTCVTPCAPDYVFESDYELMPLDELRTFVNEEKHLPNVPSAEELIGPINMSALQMKLLEKIEELALYTLSQQETIDELRSRLAALEEASE